MQIKITTIHDIYIKIAHISASYFHKEIIMALLVYQAKIYTV